MLYDMAKGIVREEPPTLHPELAGLMGDPYPRRSNANPAACIDVFVHDFLG